MSKHISAVYEQGVIRPLEPVSLKEGEELEIVLLPRENKTRRRGNPAQVLAGIARLPVEGASDGFSGADHDQVLYPKETR